MRVLLSLFVVFLASSQCAPIRRHSGKLYDPSDNVEILDVSNFKEKVFNSSHAWLIEFYASWCGDCQRFAPVYKQFASDILQWQDVIRLGVVECSDEINFEICREFEVRKYPTVRYFHESYTYGIGEFFSGDEKNNTKPKNTLLKQIEKELNKGRGHLYPDIRPYNSSDLSNLFHNQPVHVQHGFLYVEDTETSIASHVAMNIHKTNATIRKALPSNKDLVDNLKLKEFPSLIIKKRNEDNFKVVVSKDLNSVKNLQGQISDYLKSENVAVVTENYEPVIPTNSTDNEETEKIKARAALRERVRRMGDVVFQADLEAGLRGAFGEISLTKDIIGDKLDALRNFVKIITKYFPLGLDQDIFYDKLENFITNVSFVKGEEFGNIVNEAVKNNTRLFSSPKTYVACMGSREYRQHPCSLWKLFHYLTVNSALRNVNNRRAKPGEVLDAMLGYAKHFFGCSQCSEHFQEMAKNRHIEGVKSLDESVLWLWGAHNEVNERLAGDITEDPEFPKVQFPSKLRCPQCRNKDDSWNEIEVLKYLKKMYNSYNVRYIASNTHVLFDGLD